MSGSIEHKSSILGALLLLFSPLLGFAWLFAWLERERLLKREKAF